VGSEFDLVVLDVGGVLVKAGRTWLEDAERAGFSVTPSQLELLIERTRSLPRRSTGEIDSETYFRRFAEASGLAYTEEDARRISHASLVAEYPDVHVVFDALDAVGMPTALLCNVNDEEWARFFPADTSGSEFPTLLRARHRFASHIMGVAKPQERAFREVERVTGFQGTRIIFFDDREENVAGAEACGWTAKLVDYRREDTAQQLLGLLRAHAVIP
jgi:putative hydrolase of the HAD superfamily